MRSFVDIRIDLCTVLSNRWDHEKMRWKQRSRPSFPAGRILPNSDEMRHFIRGCIELPLTQQGQLGVADVSPPHHWIDSVTAENWQQIPGHQQDLSRVLRLQNVSSWFGRRCSQSQRNIGSLWC